MTAALLTRPVVDHDALDLWLAAAPRAEAVDRLDLSELNDAERTRAASFIRPTDGATYATAHIALRRLLGAYLGMDPADVPFVRQPCPGCGGPHGRPAVAETDPPLHFSLSHSHGLVLVGVAARPVGADVERLPRAETAAVCLPRLHPRERDELGSLPEESRPLAFGQLWTRKEAFLKGLGTGLSRGPDVDYLGSDVARRPAGWTVLDVPAGKHHNAAVALRGDAPTELTLRRVPAEALFAGGRIDRPSPRPFTGE
ncbi:hypothetical protein GCM10010218_52690 [Streptomyces mashuensis]|uniref:4'-phosphopantetheinyl transferase domain-containing protein n=1 Tax=Streptomyces mashuensis TaxID=33904 RepID=A0A919EEH8_9ACTN|nr:4'-phosphopantetheinyl transferase superfamily protein [Streptomyces mashuensis]GHF64571.1 hypothetical protein GCM10010218_52690 [Streptomyces mashuensis]